MSKIPPQALDIEKAFLGALLIECEKISSVKDVLSKEAFYDPKNEKVYDAILEINRKGSKVDILTVTQFLTDSGSEVKASYVSGLTARVGSALHINEHMAIIYDKWAARECIRIGHDLSEKAYSDADILETILEVRGVMNDRINHFLGINSTGIHISVAANKSLEDYFKRKKSAQEGKPVGVPTVFTKLNKLTGGLQRGQLIVLAGRPGVGKTSIAISFLTTAAETGFSAAFYSLETSSPRLMDKVICGLSDIPFSDYKTGKMQDIHERAAEAALGKLDHWQVTLNDSMLTSIEQIHASSRKLKDTEGLGAVFIDYLQLMKTTDKTGSREHEVSTISRKAKMMAMDLDVPVVLLSQLNRSVENRADKRPMLSDLRESGAIEQDADIVLFAYRDSLYNDSAPTNEGEIIIAKHREGETGILKFHHNDPMTRFMDPVEESPFPTESDRELFEENDKPF